MDKEMQELGTAAARGERIDAISETFQYTRSRMCFQPCAYPGKARRVRAAAVLGTRGRCTLTRRAILGRLAMRQEIFARDRHGEQSQQGPRPEPLLPDLAPLLSKISILNRSTYARRKNEGSSRTFLVRTSSSVCMFQREHTLGPAVF
jgi:hypothetical protein